MSAPRGALLGALLGLLTSAGCGNSAAPASSEASGSPASGAPVASSPAPVDDDDVPASMRECHQCHRRVVETFLRHGMADSLGALPVAPHGELANPSSGNRYRLEASAAGGTLTATFPDGGQRRQRLVGRIGAGRLDTSFVATELDPLGHDTGRLFFIPLEWITGQGLALAPFEQGPAPAGLDQPVTPRCLECHTDEAAALDELYPRNGLGSDALARLRPLDCSTCHGDVARHADLMLDRAQPSAEGDIGLTRLSGLPAPEQRDHCARCHLEGDANLVLAPRGAGPLPGTRPTLVPARPGDDFRFVGQLERLALSPCYRGSPQMTCTSCHLPHTAVAEQGVAAFDEACLRCHAVADCSRPATLRVEDVTGAPARSASGCVDCHVRRSQPFDIPGLVSADHFVRRSIPRPATAPYRSAADPSGPLVVFDDGRLAEALATEGGRRWSEGLIALGLAKQQRMAEAGALLARFPAPGSDAARAPSAPAGLPPLEASADFHHVRGLVLEALGERAAAEAAYGDALACDPEHPESRVNRGSLRLARGDAAGAAEDASLLAGLHPDSEMPWNLRALVASRAGDGAAAAAALAESAARWPSSAAVWQQLGRLLLARGDPGARAALERAAVLAPGLPGLQQELQQSSGR